MYRIDLIQREQIADFWSLIERIKINSRHLAKHQRTWMRHFPQVRYVDVASDDTVESVADRVQQEWNATRG